MANPAWLDGSIEPFGAEKLNELYPDGCNAQWQRAVDRRPFLTPRMVGCEWHPSRAFGGSVAR